MTDILEDALRKSALQEYLIASKYATKETIETRVLEKAMRILGKKKIADGIYVHPEVSAYLSRFVPPDHPVFDERDSVLVRKIYSADRHDPETLCAFADLLDRKIVSDPSNSEGRRTINRAFAVDGFKGSVLNEYVDNLKFPMTPFADDRKSDEKTEALKLHVTGVRSLYEMVENASLEKIAIALRNAMDFVESADPILRQLTNGYLTHAVDRFDDIKRYFGVLKESVEEKVLMDERVL